MTTRALLIADTHVPKRARALPAQVWDEVEAADLVIHAGDWVSEDLLDELQGRSHALLACWGNNDGPGLRARLPEAGTAVVGGVRIAVVHETGAAKGREARMQDAFPDTDLLVFGHSHIPWDTTTPNGLRLLNPGSRRTGAASRAVPIWWRTSATERSTSNCTGCRCAPPAPDNSPRHRQEPPRQGLLRGRPVRLKPGEGLRAGAEVFQAD